MSRVNRFAVGARPCPVCGARAVLVARQYCVACPACYGRDDAPEYQLAGHYRLDPSEGVAAWNAAVDEYLAERGDV